MGLSRTFFDINGVFGRKSQFSAPYRYLTPPLRGFLLVFVMALGLKKTMVIPDGGKSLTICAYV